MKSEMSELTRKLVKAIGPLTAKEERVAIKTATAHVAKDLSDHHRILGVELRIEKPADGGKVERKLGVLILDYGSRRNFEVLLNATGNVIGVADLGSRQPAYTREE